MCWVHICEYVVFSMADRGMKIWLKCFSQSRVFLWLVCTPQFLEKFKRKYKKIKKTPQMSM